jgi:hypothetical protein
MRFGRYKKEKAAVVDGVAKSPPCGVVSGRSFCPATLRGFAKASVALASKACCL